jgi:hypothetical protein
MATYDVQVHDRRGAMRHVLAHVDAGSPSEAILLARRTLPVSPGLELYAVYRHRRLRRRQLVGTFPAGGGGDDGLAGVREPRRPHPNPPSLRAEADLPAYPDN